MTGEPVARKQQALIGRVPGLTWLVNLLVVGAVLWAALMWATGHSSASDNEAAYGGVGGAAVGLGFSRDAPR